MKTFETSAKQQQAKPLTAMPAYLWFIQAGPVLAHVAIWRANQQMKDIPFLYLCLFQYVSLFFVSNSFKLMNKICRRHSIAINLLTKISYKCFNQYHFINNKKFFKNCLYFQFHNWILFLHISVSSTFHNPTIKIY